MKCQILFSWEKISLVCLQLSAEFVHRVAKVLYIQLLLFQTTCVLISQTKISGPFCVLDKDSPLYVHGD